jgi:muramoyltetrapeptide carboxypeptidase LdcA involved in peptidoglycan recycling
MAYNYYGFVFTSNFSETPSWSLQSYKNNIKIFDEKTVDIKNSEDEEISVPPQVLKTF